MHRAKQKLHENSGMAMILVLCIGALLVALSAAMVYAASMLTASANRQLLEQNAYELANSFADVLERQLKDETSGFYKFVNGNSGTEFRGANFVADKNYSFVAENLTEGAETITITLRKHAIEEDEIEEIETDGGYVEKKEAVAYMFDVTVMAEYQGAQAKVSRTYQHQATYPVYYTYNGKNYMYSSFDSYFYAYPMDGTVPISPPEDVNETQLHYELDKPATGATFTLMVAGKPLPTPTPAGG